MRYVTLDSAKARAPLDSLCHHLGIELGWDDHAVCPFHDDHEPSFYIWFGSEGEQRWWCQVCGFGGDQVDLLRRLYPELSFSTAVVRLDEIADDLPATAPRKRRHRDPESDMRTLHEEVQRAMERAAEPEFDGYISAYATGFVGEADPDGRFAWDRFLRELGWGVDDLGRVVMPHWDADGMLTGAKIRRVDGSRAAIPGSTFRHLYPAWHLPLHGTVLLVEGETDAAWTMRQNGLGADIRSIPRGAPGMSDPPSPDDALLVKELEAWDDVILAFDGDEAGDVATERWSAAVRSTRGNVGVMLLPRGHDLRSAGLPVVELLRTALS